MHAMMLDMKRTFDEIVEAHAEPGRAAQILANPFYQSLSSSFSGTQEYMAMEKLGQLRRAEEWDLIVVDTPPSRSALDFLDAPKRLGRFLDGRLIRVLMVPARAGGRAYMKVLSAGFGMVTNVLTKVLGAQVLRDAQTFVSALDTMFGGFRERAEHTYQLLQTPGTAFVVIAAPEPDALREASYFVERLADERMPLAGLIVNRVHRSLGAAIGCAQPRGRGEPQRLPLSTGRRRTTAARRPDAASGPRAEAYRTVLLGASCRAGNRGACPGRGCPRPRWPAGHREYLTTIACARQPAPGGARPAGGAGRDSVRPAAVGTGPGCRAAHDRARVSWCRGV